MWSSNWSFTSISQWVPFIFNSVRATGTIREPWIWRIITWIRTFTSWSIILSARSFVIVWWWLSMMTRAAFVGPISFPKIISIILKIYLYLVNDHLTYPASLISNFFWIRDTLFIPRCSVITIFATSTTWILVISRI